MKGFVDFLTRVDGLLAISRTDFSLMGGTSVFFGLFSNLAVFIIMVAVYGILNESLEKRSRFRRQVILGTVFGLFVYICMHVRIPVAPGVQVDQRNAIVILAGFFGGPLSAVIAAAIGAGYRAFLGGIGVYGGILGLGLAVIARDDAASPSPGDRVAMEAGAFFHRRHDIPAPGFPAHRQSGGRLAAGEIHDAALRIGDLRRGIPGKSPHGERGTPPRGGAGAS